MSNPISIAALAASDYALIGFGCYFVGFFISWFLGARAYRRLSPEEAATERNASSKAGIFMRIGVFVGIPLVSVLGFLRLPRAGLAAGMLFWLLLAYIAVIQAWNRKRLRGMGINPDYMRAHFRGMIFFWIALAGLLLGLVSSQFVVTSSQPAGAVEGSKGEAKAAS